MWLVSVFVTLLATFLISFIRFASFLFANSIYITRLNSKLMIEYKIANDFVSSIMIMIVGYRNLH